MGVDPITPKTQEDPTTPKRDSSPPGTPDFLNEDLEPVSPTGGLHAFMRQITPQVEGSICETVLAALQLPEAIDEHMDMDEVCIGWLRLRRSADCLLQRPQLDAQLPASNIWRSESRPPTQSDLRIVADFHAFVLKNFPSLEDSYYAFCARTSGFSLFGLRNGIGLFSKCADKRVEGVPWPEELPSAEKLFSSLCNVLRPDGAEIPMDKYLQLRKFLDSEATVNKVLSSLGDKAIEASPQSPCSSDRSLPEDSAEGAGARLVSIISLSEKSPLPSNVANQMLECVEMLMDMEPKASSNTLMLRKTGSNLASVVDVVLRQGIPCINDDTLMRLWRICERVVSAGTGLGKPRPPLKEQSKAKYMEIPLGGKARVRSSSSVPGTPDPSSARSSSSSLREAMPSIGMGRTQPSFKRQMTEPARDSLKLCASQPNFQRQMTDEPRASSDAVKRLFSPPKDEAVVERLSTKKEEEEEGEEPAKKRPGSAKRPDSTGSEKGSARGSKSKVNGSAVAVPSLPSLAKSQSVGAIRAPSPVEPLVLSGRWKDATEKIVVRKAFGLKKACKSTASLPEIPSLMLKSKSNGKLELPSLKEAPNGRPPKQRLVRAASISLAPAEMDLLSDQLSAMTGDADINDWELRFCGIFWRTMPPQTITYAIGVAMHSDRSRMSLTKFTRAAWSLLDKARAVDCGIGCIGTTRLRLEMDMLVEQLGHKIKYEEEASLADFLAKVKMTMMHLESICGADPRFAEVAALYGVAFIVESISSWARNSPGGESASQAADGLQELLRPSLSRLFQKQSVGDDLWKDLLSEDPGSPGLVDNSKLSFP